MIRSQVEAPFAAAGSFESLEFVHSSHRGRQNFRWMFVPNPRGEFLGRGHLGSLGEPLVILRIPGVLKRSSFFVGKYMTSSLATIIAPPGYHYPLSLKVEYWEWMHHPNSINRFKVLRYSVSYKDVYFQDGSLTQFLVLI